MTEAKLGIAVESSQVKEGIVNLDAFAASASRAEAANEKLGKSGARLDQIPPKANAASQSIRVASFQTANLAAQLQDIVVQLQAGQNPFQIALQQGTQITPIFGEKGAAGAVGLLKAAFVSLINPVSLGTLGIIAFGGVAIQALGSLIPKAESATEALERHRKEVLQIVAGYSEAEKAAKAYFDEQQRRPIGAILSDLGKQLKDAKSTVESFKAYADARAGDTTLSFLTDDMRDLIRQFNEGGISARELYTKLRELRNSDLGPLAFAIQPFIDKLSEAALKAGSLYDAIIGIDHISAGLSLNAGVQNALVQKIEGDKSAEAYQVQLDAINALSPAQQADVARRQKELELRDKNLTAARLQQEVDQAGALAYAAASRQISLAEQARLRAANDNIDATRTQLELIGKSAGEAARLQFVQQELAAAQEAAAQNGVSVSQAYIDKIKELGAAYGDLQQQIAETATLNDLMFERSQIGLTPGQQDARATARSIYGDDLTSSGAQFLMQQVEINHALKDFNDIGEKATKGFLSTLRQDLMNGVSAWQSFGDAAAGVLDTIAQKALDMAASGIWDMIFGAIGGALGGGIGGGGRLGLGLTGPNVYGGAGGFVPGLTGPSLLSFDGGGYTGSGPRTGGMDGRGGFPAMLHPNETVLDHTRGQTNDNRPSISIGDVIVNAPGASKDDAQVIAKRVRGELVDMLNTNFPDAVQSVQRNPRARGRRLFA